jgi:hypothetical protein
MTRSGLAFTLALAAAALLAPASPGHAAEPRVFLSWRAPEGSARAVREVRPGCADTTGHRDTLWVSFDPGRDTTTILGLRVEIVFRAAAGETLSSHWDLGEGTQLTRIRIDFQPDEIPGDAELWSEGASGGGFFRRTPSQGTLTVIGAIPATVVRRVHGGRPYVFARVLIPHPRRAVEHCDQAVCIALESASIGYNVGDDPPVTAGERFVTWNPAGDPCERWRRATRHEPWRPGSRTAR